MQWLDGTLTKIFVLVELCHQSVTGNWNAMDSNCALLIVRGHQNRAVYTCLSSVIGTVDSVDKQNKKKSVLVVAR